MPRKYTIRDPNYHEKHSKAMKKLYSDPEFKKKKDDKTREVQSDPEYREKRSIAAKERCSDPAIRKLMSERAKEKWADPEYRSKQMKIKLDPEYRLSQSEKQKGMRTGKLSPSYGKPVSRIHGLWFTLPDNNQIWLRSSYEIRTLNILLLLNIKWQYEPKYFPLDNIDKTYRPDFYLPEYNIWWEVKGWMDDYSKIKLTQFFIQYPNEKLKILYLEDIIQLENAVKSNIEIDITRFGTTNIR